MITFLNSFYLPAGLTLVLFGIAYLIRFLAYHLIRRISQMYASYLSVAIQAAVLVGGGYALSIYLGISPTIVLAIIAIFTAGISLAADRTMANGIAGGVILLDGNIAVGDQVTIAGDVVGLVTKIGFSSTVIQSNTRGIVVVPNSMITDSIIINHSRLPAVEMSLTLPMYDNHDISRASDLIKKALSSEGFTSGYKILHDWQNGGQVYAVVVKVADYNKRREIMSSLSVKLTNYLTSEDLPLGSVLFTRES